MPSRSIEFLVHYPPCTGCGFVMTSADRFPLDTWICPSCATANTDNEIQAFFNLMSPEERNKFAQLLRKWAVVAKNWPN